MDINKAEKIFPNFFKNFKMPVGAKCENINVYRLCFWGEIDRQAFYGSYEAQAKGLISIKNISEDSDDPGQYSTSCFENIRDIKKMKKLFSRHYPEVIVAYGTTEKSCGPHQRTIERESDRRDSHVDWWIYENSDPQNYFREEDI